MSQNRTSSDFSGTSQSSTPGTPNTETERSSTATGQGGFNSGTGATGTGAGTAMGVAHEYGGKLSEAATHAKDYVSDKVTVVGEKLKDLQNVDYREMAENAKDYARQNPGQAILISAAAGLLLGLILRGRR